MLDNVPLIFTPSFISRISRFIFASSSTCFSRASQSTSSVFIRIKYSAFSFNCAAPSSATDWFTPIIFPTI